MKIIPAQRYSKVMDKKEVEDFLTKGRRLLRLATLDENNEPRLSPLWYHYEDRKIFFVTGEASKKAQYIKRNGTVYFCVDEGTLPYRGVRGKGKARVIRDRNFARKLNERMIMRYLGSMEHPIAKEVLSMTDISVIVEITPRFFCNLERIR